MDERTSQPEAWPAELRVAGGNGGQQPIYVHTAPASAVGWKISTIVLAVSTVVLAILLSGQLAAPQQVAAPEASVPVEQAPVPSNEAPPISDVSQLVGTLGFAIMQSYSQEGGWPEAVSADKDGVVTTAEGIELGTLPRDCNLAYVVADDGSSFTLTLVDKDGESAVFGPAA